MTIGGSCLGQASEITSAIYQTTRANAPKQVLIGLVAAPCGSELSRNSQLCVGSVSGHVLASASFTLGNYV